MGGSEAVEWLGALEASFEAALAREEEVAAADLAFSLRQDVDLREALARAGSGWALLGPGGASQPVEEVGLDYVRAGTLLVPSGRSALRSSAGPSPKTSDRKLLEVLGEACRMGAEVTVTHEVGAAEGRLARVAKDHVTVRNAGGETVVGLAGIQAVRLGSYSASRGLSG